LLYFVVFVRFVRRFTWVHVIDTLSI
jgi:hypothetical protein